MPWVSIPRSDATRGHLRCRNPICQLLIPRHASAGCNVPKACIWNFLSTTRFFFLWLPDAVMSTRFAWLISSPLRGSTGGLARLGTSFLRNKRCDTLQTQATSSRLSNSRSLSAHSHTMAQCSGHSRRERDAWTGEDLALFKAELRPTADETLDLILRKKIFLVSPPVLKRLLFTHLIK